MNRDLLKKAYEIGAGLLEAMDTASFWGEERFDDALCDTSGRTLREMDEARARVVKALRGKA